MTQMCDSDHYEPVDGLPSTKMKPPRFFVLGQNRSHQKDHYQNVDTLKEITKLVDESKGEFNCYALLDSDNLTAEELASCARLLKEAGVVSIRSIKDNPPTWY